jgi:hypothetical protein
MSALAEASVQAHGSLSLYEAFPATHILSAPGTPRLSIYSDGGEAVGVYEGFTPGGRRKCSVSAPLPPAVPPLPPPAGAASSDVQFRLDAQTDTQLAPPPPPPPPPSAALGEMTEAAHDTVRAAGAPTLDALLGVRGDGDGDGDDDGDGDGGGGGEGASGLAPPRRQRSASRCSASPWRGASASDAAARITDESTDADADADDELDEHAEYEEAIDEARGAMAVALSQQLVSRMESVLELQRELTSTLRHDDASAHAAHADADALNWRPTPTYVPFGA